MLAGDFQRKMRKLNRNLRIWCGDNDKMAAGIFIVSPQGEFEDICGIDKNYVPRYTEYREDGGLRKGGWQRALKILIGKGLIDRRKAEKEFGVQIIGARAPSAPEIQQNKGLQKLKSMGIEIIQSGSY